MPHPKPKLLVIAGPTASGKTALSILLAQRFNGEVISADSRQVYRGLDVGTEKVSTEDMAGIPHHLIDIVDVNTVYTAADFKRDAAEAITSIVAHNHLPIIAGGTFFYVDVLLGRSLTADVPPNTTLRNTLAELSADTLYQQLVEVDADRAATIDRHNKRRLIRALEIVAAKGQVPTGKQNDCPYDVLLLGIERDRKELRARIRARAEAALSRGLIKETRALLETEVSPARLSEIGLEYRLVLQYQNGELTEGELIKRLEQKVWQYAKRQLTWLKRDPTIVWIDPHDETTIFSTIENWLKD